MGKQNRVRTGLRGLRTALPGSCVAWHGPTQRLTANHVGWKQEFRGTRSSPLQCELIDTFPM